MMSDNMDMPIDDEYWEINGITWRKMEEARRLRLEKEAKSRIDAEIEEIGDDMERLIDSVKLLKEEEISIGRSEDGKKWIATVWDMSGYSVYWDVRGEDCGSIIEAVRNVVSAYRKLYCWREIEK